MALRRLASGYQQLDWPQYRDEFDGFVSRWGLEPEIAVRALALGFYSRELLGLRLWITSGRRSEQQQAHLRRMFESGERKGLFRPALNSPHVEGIGIDVGADFTLSPAQWESVGRIGEALGLRWGGRFRDHDPVHFDGR